MTRYVSLFALFGMAALAQVQSGTIVGTVTDQGGAAVGGARITLVNEGTRFTRTVETGAAGNTWPHPCRQELTASRRRCRVFKNW